MDKVIHWTNVIYLGQLLSSGVISIGDHIYPLDKTLSVPN
jgi:hypothetical protein